MATDSMGFPTPDTAPQKKLELLKRLRQKGPMIRTQPESFKGKTLEDEEKEKEESTPEKPANIIGAY